MSRELREFICSILKVCMYIADRTDNPMDNKVIAVMQMLFGCDK